MADSIGTAYLTLVPKLDQNFAKQAETSGQSFGDSFGNSFSSKLSTAAKTGAAAMAATVASVGLAANAFKNAINATAEYGDNVDKMSQKIGFSASSYQEWAYVMERAGTSVDILQAGMKTLSTQAQKNAEEFQMLGISEQEVASLSKEDLFGRVIEGLSGMEDGTERTAIATKLLGKSATELSPLLNEGSDAIREQMEMAQKYGLVMSDAAVKASADFEDSMTTLNGAIRGAKNALMGEFLPSATKVSDGLTKLITGNVDEGIKDISNGVKDMLGKITKAFPQFLSNGSKIVLEMLKGLNNKMPDIVNGLVSLLNKLINKIPTYLPLIFSAAVKLFMGIVQAIPSILASLLSAIGSLISSGVSKVLSYLPNMLSAGKSLIQNVANGIWNLAGTVWSNLTSIIRELPGKVTAWASSMWNAGWSLLNNVVDGIWNVGSSLGSAVWDIVSSAPGAVADFFWSMYSAGGDLLQGLINGLWDSAGNVANTLWDICSNAVESFKSFFGIHSPSRLMRKLGGYVGDGLTLGIEDSEKDVDKAMRGLMDATYGQAADYGIGVNASLNASRNTLNADVVGAIDTLHNDLYAIIKDATPDGITGRQFGRLVHKYA